MLKEKVQSEMIAAMKAGEKGKKTALSVLLAALKNKEIDKRSPLNEVEELEVVAKMVKQVKESLETTPETRMDLKEKYEFELALYEAYMPEQMSEEEIANTIEMVLRQLDILGTAKPSDKGRIMKELMPKVKGKADGKLVNELLTGYLK